MMDRLRHGRGFIAALDQSGGSTPKTLVNYGIAAGAWSSEEEMFDLIHAMRCRILTSPAFTSATILAAILFERTMDGTANGQPVPRLSCRRGSSEEGASVRAGETSRGELRHSQAFDTGQDEYVSRFRSPSARGPGCSPLGGLYSPEGLRGAGEEREDDRQLPPGAIVRPSSEHERRGVRCDVGNRDR